MKKVLLIALGCVTALMVLAQEQEQQSVPVDSLPFDVQKQAFIYSTAARYSDPMISRMALYNLLAYNPANTAIMDSLALSYIDYQQYASAVLVAQDALRINPKDMLATEIAAVAFENLGLADRSVTYYETLNLNEPNINTLYKITFLQFQLKRFAEARTNCDILIGDAEVGKATLFFQKNQNENQEVPMVAGIYRLKAMVEEEAGNVDQARANYNKALEIAPDFVLPKLQLEKLN
ncbi:MAG: hypothetical protein R8G66_00435 [Cytophagales bacterium]|nr:hypothetical protein [Cytophagales bacterium]